jgi:hypothetical protein
LSILQTYVRTPWCQLIAVVGMFPG